MLDTTLKAILTASRRTKRDQQLKRFRYFKGGPEIGVRTNKTLLRMCDAQQTIKIGM
jgi:hypothetical protein